MTQPTTGNRHHVMKRSKHGIYKPKAYNLNIYIKEPANFEEATTSSKWKTAMDIEYEALVKNKT